MDTPCIDWTGAVSPEGYARVYNPEQKRTVKAHRFFYEIWHGPIPQGKVVMHLCDNRKCVNPDHLELGTQGENLKDMHDKGRHNPKLPVGEEHHFTTLSQDEAIEILRRAAPGNYRKLAKEYGVSRVTIRNIALGKTWAHIQKYKYDTL